jgi:hypothetical protein
MFAVMTWRRGRGGGLLKQGGDRTILQPGSPLLLALFLCKLHLYAPCKIVYMFGAVSGGRVKVPVFGMEPIDVRWKMLTCRLLILRCLACRRKAAVLIRCLIHT